ncbi:MAG: hypothetical protein HQK75_18440 [Candidatus Magnetomorum sp.]|nr:hypothetical protein [Candidatus Magnetomorum sp.]
MSHIIVTETLAKLYIKHGVLDKAKEVYSLLLEQHPVRDDYKAIIEDLEGQIDQMETPPSDYRETLDQGFAKDQNGMALNDALDAFDDHQAQDSPNKKIHDPEILDQIMLMTEYESLSPMEEADIPSPLSIPAKAISDSLEMDEPLKRMINQWFDLLLIKRKMNQLNRLKQRIH